MHVLLTGMQPLEKLNFSLFRLLAYITTKYHVLAFD